MGFLVPWQDKDTPMDLGLSQRCPSSQTPLVRCRFVAFFDRPADRSDVGGAAMPRARAFVRSAQEFLKVLKVLLVEIAG